MYQKNKYSLKINDNINEVMEGGGGNNIWYEGHYNYMHSDSNVFCPPPPIPSQINGKIKQGYIVWPLEGTWIILTMRGIYISDSVYVWACLNVAQLGVIFLCFFLNMWSLTSKNDLTT